MYKYTIKRLLLMIPTLVGGAILVFLMMRLVPGDVCLLKLGGEGAMVTDVELAACRKEFGLDQHMVWQFLDFMKGLVLFDLGESMWTGRAITYEVGLRFQLTLQLAIMATLVSIIIAIPLGVISAVKQNSWMDYGIRVFSIAGIAIPSFWLGIVIIIGMLIITQWWSGIPWIPPIDYKPIWEDPAYNLTQLIWPALATGYRYSAVATRMTRSAMLEVLREDYVRTARAKGLVEKLIITRHALKNAMLPVVTIIGIEFAFLIGGLVVTEQVFNLNGIGKLLIDSVQQHDYTMTQALVMLIVMIFVLTNFVVDLAYAWFDPRIRYS